MQLKAPALRAFSNEDVFVTKGELMPGIDRIDIKKRRPIPPYIKFILLIAVFAGIWIKSCSHKAQSEIIKISIVEITEITSGNIDVKFTVSNSSTVDFKKKVHIKVFLKSGELLADKITQIEIPGRKKKRYLKVLQKFNMPLKYPEDVDLATVDIYETKGF